MVYDVDQKAFKILLHSAGNKWRQFKSTLWRNHIKPYKDDNPDMLKHPPSRYTYVKQQDWDSFIASRCIEKLKVI